MASVEVSKLSQQELAELACTYSALILHDDGQDITGTAYIDAGDKLKKLINASGVKVESYWPGMFAKALEGQDIASFFNFGDVAGGGSAPAPTPAAQPAKVETKKEETKKQTKKPAKPQEKAPQEDDGDMGGLFD